VLAVGIGWVYLEKTAGPVTPKDELYRQILVGKSVPVGKNDKVIYSGSATEADAQNLARALSAAGYFAGKGGAAFLSKGADGTTITFITSDKDPAKPGDGSKPGPGFGPRLVPLAWDDPDYLARARTTGTVVAPSVGGPPVNIALLTSDGVLEKVFKVDMRIAKIGTDDSVWYSPGATLSDAQALGNALLSLGFFRNQGSRALLSKQNGNWDVSLIVEDGVWDDPKVVTGLRSLSSKLSRALGGEPVRIHLLDGKMEPKKDL